jgi:hypothetical protein
MMQGQIFTLLRTGAFLLSTAGFTMQLAAQTGCDLNADGVVNTTDVNSAISLATGATSPCTASIIGNNVCNVVMVQRVINAAQGRLCGVGAVTWTASTSTGVTGYRVYRSTVNGGPYTLLTTTPVTGTRYVDGTLQLGTTYYYVITAVNSANAESPYSTPTTLVVPASL